MNKQKARFWMVYRIALVLFSVLLLAGCGSRNRARVGELRTESQSVELGDANPVHADIELGAGDLQVTGGTQKLLEADFTYNVDKLKPEVSYKDGTLTVRQPETEGMPALQGITGFRNEWDLRLNNETPMDLKVNVGAGTSNLQLGDLALTGLDINLGAGQNTIDLSGNWTQDLDVSINSGAGTVKVVLPKDVGVRVEAGAGVGTIQAPDLTKDGDVYTNAAYGKTDATLRVNIGAGVGTINLVLK